MVVFPENTEQIVDIVQLCNEVGVPFLPRGAGTSLAGGALPIGGGVMIVMTKMKEILEINLRDRYAVVQPGVVNVWLTQALKGSGYHYAPDPSSQGACTIGGNVATNSGGPHTLKYGVTTIRDSYGSLLPLMQVRDAIARGDTLGPRMLVAGRAIVEAVPQR